MVAKKSAIARTEAHISFLKPRFGSGTATWTCIHWSKYVTFLRPKSRRKGVHSVSGLNGCKSYDEELGTRVRTKTGAKI
jgi:hypothetical protein